MVDPAAKEVVEKKGKPIKFNFKIPARGNYEQPRTEEATKVYQSTTLEI